MPKQYLISLSIGPVQDFIAAARRTRDLWFGSYVLSEVSKAAALSFSKFETEYIFPAPETNLQADSKENPNKNNVGNKLLVLVETDTPQVVLALAKDAARERWRLLAEESYQKIEVNDDIWMVQKCDVLEFFGAWVYLENRTDYGAIEEQNKGRKRLDKLLNARKNTREFISNPVQYDNAVAKSSLDGLRESVLLTDMKLGEKYKLGLSTGEELDCIGVVKRLGGNAEQFTPLSRLAIDPWLRNAQITEKSSELSEIKEIISEIERTNLGMVSLVTGNDHIYTDFTFDGQLLYDFRIQAELDSLTRLNKGEDKETQDKIKEVKKHLKKLQGKLSSAPFNDLPKPLPYMAILAADGDRMGELLDGMTRLENHQEISATLAEFATQVPATVREFRGHCIYAGGDDVLALLPLDHAIACAEKLANDFNETLSTISYIPADKIPTLSVGLGVSHFLTPMNKQLDLARRAEQLAKSNDKSEGKRKNALAILLQPRSGTEISFRERWNSLTRPSEILGNWMAAHNDNLLPKRFGYELHEASFALNWCTTEIHGDFIEQEVSRILERKRTADGKPLEKKVMADICQRAAEIGFASLANELIITQRFAQVHQLSNKPVPGGVKQ